MADSSLNFATKPASSAMDYEFLRREGIRHLERLSGQLWTDFNAHDPGITILEQVCYALTDLAHRIDYSMPDLLAGPDGAPPEGLFSPAEILSSAPVTLDDLRRLVIDDDEVKNAWIEIGGERTTPDGESSRLKGLYRVLIELVDSVYIDGNREQKINEIKERVVRKLHSYRGLGEDFEEISVLESEEIRVEARIEIETVEDSRKLMRDILKRIADYISPPVRFRTLSELLTAGRRTDEIFNGPLLEHGFIDAEELRRSQRRDSLHTSDLIHLIMDIPGVRTVSAVAFSAVDPAYSEKVVWEDWYLRLNPKKAPKFSLENSTITLERNQLPVEEVDQQGDYPGFSQLLGDRSEKRDFVGSESVLSIPAGRDRKLANYYSLQHQLPSTYGVGSLGLPTSATPQRKAQAKQLSAYLMFFDQLLANYFTQLARAKDLFSPEGAGKEGSTYFTQMIDDPSLKLEMIRKGTPVDHEMQLQNITKDAFVTDQDGHVQNEFNRRNRFLNHLLARFAEQFTDYSLALYDTVQNDHMVTQKKAARVKQELLKNYVEISCARGSAFNYLEPWGRNNLSGLERKLYGILGLDVEEPRDRFYMVEHILLRPMVEEAQRIDPILDPHQCEDPYSLQLSFVFSAKSERIEQNNFEAFVERTLLEVTPAHLLISVQWLNKQDMTTFGNCYTCWLQTRLSYWQRKHFGVTEVEGETEKSLKDLHNEAVEAQTKLNDWFKARQKR